MGIIARLVMITQRSTQLAGVIKSAATNAGNAIWLNGQSKSTMMNMWSN
jgi:hypothetical protein